jgi:hypothetical protein
MKVQFRGSVDADTAADAFMLSILARHKGNSVTAGQVWKSLRTRGFVPSDGRATAQNDPDEGAAVAEVSRRLQKWLDQGLIGGEQEPESITGDRHFWVLGNTLTKG